MNDLKKYIAESCTVQQAPQKNGLYIGKEVLYNKKENTDTKKEMLSTEKENTDTKKERLYNGKENLYTEQEGLYNGKEELYNEKEEQFYECSACINDMNISMLISKAEIEAFIKEKCANLLYEKIQALSAWSASTDNLQHIEDTTQKIPLTTVVSDLQPQVAQHAQADNYADEVTTQETENNPIGLQSHANTHAPGERSATASNIQRTEEEAVTPSDKLFQGNNLISGSNEPLTNSAIAHAPGNIFDVAPLNKPFFESKNGLASGLEKPLTTHANTNAPGDGQAVAPLTSYFQNGNNLTPQRGEATYHSDEAIKQQNKTQGEEIIKGTGEVESIIQHEEEEDLLTRLKRQRKEKELEEMRRTAQRAEATCHSDETITNTSNKKERKNETTEETQQTQTQQLLQEFQTLQMVQDIQHLDTLSTPHDVPLATEATCHSDEAINNTTPLQKMQTQNKQSKDEHTIPGIVAKKTEKEKVPKAPDEEIVVGEKGNKIPINWVKFINYWNEKVGDSIGKIVNVKGQRKLYANARIKEYGKDAFVTVIKNISESDFLKGGNKRGWHATFDWIIKPNNFRKVLEGNYKNTDNELETYGNKYDPLADFRNGIDEYFKTGQSAYLQRLFPQEMVNHFVS